MNALRIDLPLLLALPDERDTHALRDCRRCSRTCVLRMPRFGASYACRRET